MSSTARLQTPLTLLTILVLAACGGGTDRADNQRDGEAAASAQTDAPAQVGSSPSAPVETPVGVEDIDRWEKGMAAELAAVQEAGKKLVGAKTSDDTLSALMGVQEMSTTPIGAKAAGVDPDRYQAIRSDLSAAASYLAPHLGGIDTTILSPAQREEMRQMNAAQLKQMETRVPPPVVEALKPRAEALRKQDLELVGARLKGAGM
jgi:hypothetical protein